MKKVVKNMPVGENTLLPGIVRQKEANTDAGSDIWGSLAFSRFIHNEISSWNKEASSERKDQENDHARHIEKSYREGFEKGLAAGIQKEREERIKAIDALFNEAKNKSHNAIRNLELKVINLAVEIAEQLIRKSITANPQVVEEMVTETMTHIIGSENVILKVSTDDYKIINAKYHTWLSLAGNAAEFKIEIDKRLRTGDFIIETEGGIIDAIVSDRIDVMVEELLKVSE